MSLTQAGYPMIKSGLLFSVVLVTSAVSADEEFPPGSLVVTTDIAPLQHGKQVLGRISKGSKLRVVRTSGEWVGVAVGSGERRRTGWIHKQYLRLTETPGESSHKETNHGPVRLQPRQGRRIVELPVLFYRPMFPALTGLKTSDDVAECLDQGPPTDVPGPFLAAFAAANSSISPAAGFTFRPTIVVKQHEKPSSALKKVPADAEQVLVVAVAGGVPQKVNDLYLNIYIWNFLLLATKSKEPILAGSAIASGSISPDNVKNGRISLTVLSQNTVDVFPPRFDRHCLAQLQQHFFSEEISQDVGALQRTSDRKQITPRVQELSGGDKRDPQLHIAVSNEHLTVAAYLQPADNTANRRWQFRGVGDITTVIEARQYQLYIVAHDRRRPDSQRVYHALLNAAHKRKYSYRVD
jgi:hypothetical protein